jgi:hypothetical protein
MSTKKTLKSVVIVLLMTSLGLSQSVKESFDYAPDVLDGFGDAVDGWGGPWTIFEGSIDLMNIEVGSLEFFGVPASGNFLMGTMSVSNDNQRAYRELETVWPDNGTPYWISYLMEVINFSFSDQSWQGVSLYLNNGTELVLFGKVWGQPNLGLMAHTLGGGATVSPLTWEEGLVWTVIRIDMSGDDQNEPCFMWFNPNPDSEPDTAIADVKADLQLNDGFERVVAHYGKFIDLEVYFDEIRLGTSFEDVSSAYTSVRQHENQLPNQFELSYNYPNPFNPKTIICFKLKNSDNITLKIYDLKGREITTLTDGYFPAGKHELQWDASEQPSGIYFYILQAGEYSESRKMILQK